MPSASNRWKLQFGRYLRGLREQSGRSVVEAAGVLKLSDSSVSSYENGIIRPSWPVVTELLRFYGANKAEQAEAEARWEDAGTKTKRVRMPADAPKDLRKLVRAELDASLVQVMAPLVVPGLLQTESYMRALNKAGHRFLDLSAMDEYVKARMNRQKLLGGPDPVRLHALIDEAAIRRSVGGPQIMRQQLGHLLLAGSWTNVTVQVISFDVGAYSSMGGSCMVVSYPQGTTAPGAYMEHLAGGDWVDNADDVGRITTTFEDACLFALSASDSADLIRQQQRALEQDDDENHGVA